MPVLCQDRLNLKEDVSERAERYLGPSQRLVHALDGRARDRARQRPWHFAKESLFGLDGKLYVSNVGAAPARAGQTVWRVIVVGTASPIATSSMSPSCFTCTTLPAPGVGEPGAVEGSKTYKPSGIKVDPYDGHEAVSCLGQNDHSAHHPQVVMQHAFVLEDARPRERHAEARYAQRWLR